jgi:hypothetical protein
MTRQEVSIEDAIAYLNELLDLDAKAMGAMIGSGVPCNDALRDHPTALVLATGPTGSNARIGILGLLNGLFGVRDDGLGEISAVFESDKLVRFERTPRNVDNPETVICEIGIKSGTDLTPCQQSFCSSLFTLRAGWAGARSERNEPRFFPMLLVKLLHESGSKIVDRCHRAGGQRLSSTTFPNASW